MSKDPITVVDYDLAWPRRFGVLRERIWPEVSDLALAIEHVGSTAVVGLAAKPVIDMTIVLPDRDCLPNLIDRLARLGYEHRGDLGIVGREAFKCQVDLHAHHLYACAQGELALRNHLVFRNYMRAHPKAVREYGQLKKELARRFPHDIDAYMHGKTDFITGALAAAGLPRCGAEAIAKVNRPPEERQ